MPRLPAGSQPAWDESKRFRTSCDRTDGSPVLRSVRPKGAAWTICVVRPTDTVSVEERKPNRSTDPPIRGSLLTLGLTEQTAVAHCSDELAFMRPNH